MKVVSEGFPQNKHLNKMKEVLMFSVHPVDVLENDFVPDTEEYKERRRQINAMKTQIRQSEQDLNALFGLVMNLNQYVADIRFLNKTAFNTQAVKSLAHTYGSVGRVLSELAKVDKKLVRGDVYAGIYAKLSEELDVNTFDMFMADLEWVLNEAGERVKVFNSTEPEQYHQELDLDSQVYIEAYKEGFKVRPELTSF